MLELDPLTINYLLILHILAGAAIAELAALEAEATD